ncbi:MAG: peptidoglycan-binding protein, partial [Candidatus Paceibacterota bacterium]
MYTKPQRGRTAVLLLLSLIVLASPSFVHAAFTKQLAQGSQGVEVTELQQILTQQGFYTGPVTGYFGALTKAAVMAYQVAHGLSPVGQVGPQTRSSLNTGTSSTGTTVVSSVSTTQTITSQLTLGSTGPEVIALQHFLAVQGFYTYPTLTGFFGPVTKAAVMAYQIAHNISPVGEVGPQTRAAINAQIAVSSTQTSSTVSTTGTQTTSGG